MAKKKYDFAGWATKYGIKCSDGRTIKKGAFDDCIGKTVPLVWNHDHNDMDNTIGHCYLEGKDQGVYAYCSLNETEKGKTAKELVKHGDITALSIYANGLQPKLSPIVEHGVIREVSLVLAGANPGASIDVVLMHSDNNELVETGEGYIYNDDNTVELSHSDEEGEDQEMEDNKDLKSEENLEHKDDAKEEKTLIEVFDQAMSKLDENEQTAVYAMIGIASGENSDEKENKDDAKNEEEGKDMKQNAFENKENKNVNTFSADDVKAAIADAKKVGSMKESFLQHGITDTTELTRGDALAHSIEGMDVLFPDYKDVTAEPYLLSRNTGWVSTVLSGVKHSPMSKIRTKVIDVTAEAARAKGYVKGSYKKEEVIKAFKRKTDATTIYKKQAMDRDDIVDLADFNVVAFLKKEMRFMLDEEIARAILIGDGRSVEDEDKISAEHLIPILGDNQVYTIPEIMVQGNNESEYDFAKRFIKEAVKARKQYKGSGNPTFFTTEDLLTTMLLIEDGNGRVIYDTVDKLKTALRVKDIVTVEVMEGQKRTDDNEEYDYEAMGIFVNLADYTVGADKGGAINMFDDFDIDYNKEKYLIETRISGMLTKPRSAISFEKKVAHVAPNTPAESEE